MFIRWISKLKITLFSPTTIMATEYELKVLNIDVEALKGKLNSLWAEKQTKRNFVDMSMTWILLKKTNELG